MGVHVACDGKARTLEAVECVRWWCFHPVHLVGAQRSHTGRRIGHGQQHQFVQLGHPVLVPVALVAGQHGAFARHVGFHLERAGARWFLDEVVPALAHRQPLRGAGHHHHGELVGQLRLGFGRGDLHRQVVDHFVSLDGGDTVAPLGGLLGVKLLGLGVKELVQVPHHGLGVEGGAVVELHVGAQLEGPAGLVGGVHLPVGGQAGDQARGFVGGRQVKRYQGLEHGVADEAHTLRPLVGLAIGQRDVRCGHGDPHGASGPGVSAGQAQGGADGDSAGGVAGCFQPAQRWSGTVAYTRVQGGSGHGIPSAVDSGDAGSGLLSGKAIFMPENV